MRKKPNQLFIQLFDIIMSMKRYVTYQIDKIKDKTDNKYPNYLFNYCFSGN